ncbi:MAG TPA: hypothetical protein VMR34_05180 [Candidatus Saccharimonadales bacterium]|jgi:hypothetical protein|nr:hypothetical protein [Candidatus Saccharimonadales bacterium]
MKISNSILAHLQQRRRQVRYRELIGQEAKIGGQLFGPVSPGTRREFFCLDEHTWVWHEEYRNQSGEIASKTTRYEVGPTRILKVQNGQYYTLDQEEAQRLRQAANLYYQKVQSQLYQNVV